MFEITRNDLEAFEYYKNEGYLHPEAEYAFTFETRWLIIHQLIRNKTAYYAFDMKYKKSKKVSTEPEPYHLEDIREKLLPQILRALASTRAFPWETLDPIELIKTIFECVLPAYGFALRPEQVRLSIMIYEGFMGKTVSICEAEVGSGKTMAYLVAGFVANLMRESSGLRVQPVTIATSSVELQQAIVERDIPKLSQILMETGLTPKPLSAVLRKGKEHYFCLSRYMRYTSVRSTTGSPSRRSLPSIYDDQFVERAFDLDKSDFPGSVKERICVSGGCKKCKSRGWCRYIHFVDNAMNVHSPLNFQVTNHNLYLMSKLRDNLLRESEFVVIDEAHKLKEAAQSTFGAIFSEKWIPNYVNWCRTLCKNIPLQSTFKDMLFAFHYLNMIMFDCLLNEFKEDDLDMESHTIIRDEKKYISMLEEILERLVSLEILRDEFGGHSPDLENIRNALSVLLSGEPMNMWVEQDENGYLTLCASPKYLDEILADYVWLPRKPVNHALLSGTMNANDDFSYFKREHGIQHVASNQVSADYFPSPFDYTKQTRLYISKDLPWPDQTEDYFKAIAARVVSLIHATNGHTAVLFTSYRALQRVFELAEPALSDHYEVIRMTRGNKTAIDSFRACKNGVLFASGSIWEGVDCAGDCLSSVIIVRAPFPRRSAMMELKCAECKSKREFVQSYAVPEMIIKLRQGAGRLIRTETDTGVLAVLDTRATKSKHAASIQRALNQYPKVSSIEEVENFIRTIKPSQYFEDAI